MDKAERLEQFNMEHNALLADFAQGLIETETYVLAAKRLSDKYIRLIPGEVDHD